MDTYEQKEREAIRHEKEKELDWYEASAVGEKTVYFQAKSLDAARAIAKVITGQRRYALPSKVKREDLKYGGNRNGVNLYFKDGLR